VSVYKEYFYLTALAVKLNHNLREENICMVSSDRLYEKAAREGVPFHEFYTFIERELTKAYLETLVLRNRAAGDEKEKEKEKEKGPEPVDEQSQFLAAPQEGGLRAQRKRTMSALNSRPKLRSHTATVVDQSYSIWDYLDDLF
jgi:hypothetical protein